MGWVVWFPVVSPVPPPRTARLPRASPRPTHPVVLAHHQVQALLMERVAEAQRDSERCVMERAEIASENTSLHAALRDVAKKMESLQMELATRPPAGSVALAAPAAGVHGGTVDSQSATSGAGAEAGTTSTPVHPSTGPMFGSAHGREEAR